MSVVHVLSDFMRKEKKTENKTHLRLTNTHSELFNMCIIKFRAKIKKRKNIETFVQKINKSPDTELVHWPIK